MANHTPTIFEKFEIRRHFDKKKQKWLFSIIDIVAALTQSESHEKSKSYWSTLKLRLKKEKSEVVTNCDRFRKSKVTLCYLRRWAWAVSSATDFTILSRKRLVLFLL